MQKWEYCRLVGIGKGWGFESASHNYYPELIFFTVEGEKHEKLSGESESLRVSKRIAELGLDGWEIIGVASRGPENYQSDTIYLKRPIE